MKKLWTFAIYLLTSKMTDVMGCLAILQAAMMVHAEQLSASLTMCTIKNLIHGSRAISKWA